MPRILLLLPPIALLLLNPSIDEFCIETERRMVEDQSSLRAGWSSVSSVFGLNALSQIIGLGTYEVCRKNYYLFSLYSERNSKLFDSSTPIAVGLGVATYFAIARTTQDKTNSSILSPYLIKWGSSLGYQECTIVHKKGDMSFG